MRYYSEQLGRHVECEVIWDGKSSLLGDYPVHQWDVYQHGYGPRDLPSYRETKTNEKQAAKHAPQGTTPTRVPQWVPGSGRCGCGRAIRPCDVRQRIRRCAVCRATNRKLRRSAA